MLTQSLLPRTRGKKKVMKLENYIYIFDWKDGTNAPIKFETSNNIENINEVCDNGGYFKEWEIGQLLGGN